MSFYACTLKHRPSTNGPESSESPSLYRAWLNRWTTDPDLDLPQTGVEVVMPGANGRQALDQHAQGRWCVDASSTGGHFRTEPNNDTSVDSQFQKETNEALYKAGSCQVAHSHGSLDIPTSMTGFTLQLLSKHKSLIQKPGLDALNGPKVDEYLQVAGEDIAVWKSADGRNRMKKTSYYGDYGRKREKMKKESGQRRIPNRIANSQGASKNNLAHRHHDETPELDNQTKPKPTAPNLALKTISEGLEAKPPESTDPENTTRPIEHDQIKDERQNIPIAAQKSVESRIEGRKEENAKAGRRSKKTQEDDARWG
ncbi:MAG: hypothetical protein Q9176_004461 [Flavoplaca citrina]